MRTKIMVNAKQAEQIQSIAKLCGIQLNTGDEVVLLAVLNIAKVDIANPNLNESLKKSIAKSFTMNKKLEKRFYFGSSSNETIIAPVHHINVLRDRNENQSGPFGDIDPAKTNYAEASKLTERQEARLKQTIKSLINDIKKLSSNLPEEGRASLAKEIQPLLALPKNGENLAKIEAGLRDVTRNINSGHFNSRQNAATLSPARGVVSPTAQRPTAGFVAKVNASSQTIEWNQAKETIVANLALSNKKTNAARDFLSKFDSKVTTVSQKNISDITDKLKSNILFLNSLGKSSNTAMERNAIQSVTTSIEQITSAKTI